MSSKSITFDFDSLSFLFKQFYEYCAPETKSSKSFEPLDDFINSVVASCCVYSKKTNKFKCLREITFSDIQCNLLTYLADLNLILQPTELYPYFQIFLIDKGLCFLDEVDDYIEAFFESLLVYANMYSLNYECSSVKSL